MKHRVSMRKLGRDSAHRRALLRNQVTSLLEHERIETTVAKAKELRRMADKMINHGKKATPGSYRAVQAFVQTREMRKKLFVDIGPRFADRPGGYVRVLKTRNRRGDCAPMAVVELSETERSILTPEQRLAKEMRKTKYRRGLSPPPSLSNVL
jgi:large subunit ribosomal protein L17